MARRRKREEKEQLLAELRSSGMSVAQFARERGLHAETVYRWRRARRESGARESFVEVHVPRDRAQQVAMTVDVAGRFRVEVPADFEDEHLRRVLAVVSSC